MTSQLVVNSFVSAIAFGLSSIIGLLIVPVLISRYGILAYGVIVASRSFYPTGALGIIDLGLSEVSSVIISRASEGLDGGLRGAMKSVLKLYGIALCIGVVTGGSIIVFAREITALQKIPVGEIEGFLRLIVEIGYALPLLFTNLVSEGVLKGFNQYKLIRSLEVSANLIYALVCILIVFQGGEYYQIGACYLVTSMVRALAVLVISWRFLTKVSAVDVIKNQSDQLCLISLIKGFGASKTVSTAISQFPPIVIGTLLGPTSIGLYDLIVRIPRFIKSIIGIINSSVLPFAVRLDAKGENAYAFSVASRGVVLIAIVIFPFLFAMAILSKAVLAIWVGSAIANEWAWQAACFMIPAMTSIVSFACQMAGSRQDVYVQMNKIMIFQLILQTVISLTLMKVLREKAFILGQIASSATMVFWQMLFLVEVMVLSKSSLVIVTKIFIQNLLLAFLVLPIALQIKSVMPAIVCAVAFLTLAWLFIAIYVHRLRDLDEIHWMAVRFSKIKLRYYR